MNVDIEESWKTKLTKEFEHPYFKSLAKFIKHEYEVNQCFPPAQHIFSALDHCPLDNLKVVIIGQDPYHGSGQANGLCFSVNDGVKLPPSLVNIFKEFGNLGISVNLFP
jgi:uracil-DNA glycosylase